MNVKRVHPYPTGTKATLLQSATDHDEHDKVRTTPVGSVVTIEAWNFHGNQYHYLVFCEANGATLNYSQTEADEDWDELPPLGGDDVGDVVRRLHLYCDLGVGDLRELEPLAEQLQGSFSVLVSSFRNRVNRQRQIWAAIDKQDKEGKL